MAGTPTVIERAFELARSGDVRNMDELRRRLNDERYEWVATHLSSPALVRQLRALMPAIRPNPAKNE
jgi:hypothetical protein